MVSGDKRPLVEELPDPEVDNVLSAVMLAGSNAGVAFWVTPVVGVADVFLVVSDCRTPSADEAAPRANSMTKLPDTPQLAAQFPAFVQQAMCQEKNAEKTTTLAAAGA
jgi:hypothetical protein